MLFIILDVVVVVVVVFVVVVFVVSLRVNHCALPICHQC